MFHTKALFRTEQGFYFFRLPCVRGADGRDTITFLFFFKPEPGEAGPVWRGGAAERASGSEGSRERYGACDDELRGRCIALSGSAPKAFPWEGKVAAAVSRKADDG